MRPKARQHSQRAACGEVLGLKIGADDWLYMQLKAPKCPYIANVNARPVRSASPIAADLADNIAHGVRWHDATIVAEELAVTFSSKCRRATL
jgi:hypothetical protein